MADNDQNDEYKFDEHDPLENNSQEDDIYSSSESISPEQSLEPPQSDVKRNALIAVGLIVFIVIMYKLIAGLFFGKSSVEETKTSINSAPITASQPLQTEIPPEPQLVQQAPTVVPDNNAALKQQVDSIEASEQNLQSQVSSMNDQINNMNNNIANLSSQITKLDQIISDLSTLVNKQSEEISVLMLRTQPKPVKRAHSPRHAQSATIYYINAVIPGRAWLISTNGSTLTVREGTLVPGYGVVKLIDSIQGRILTTSGRIIKFSQADS